MSIEVAINGAKSYRQLGNHLFVIHSDVASVYEITDYVNYEPKVVKDINKTFTITKNDTWQSLENKFFGDPTPPVFGSNLIKQGVRK